MPPAHASWISKAIAAAALATALVGCASTQNQSGSATSVESLSTSPFSGSARARLERTALSQTSNAFELDGDLPLPAGVQASTLEPITDPSVLEFARTPTDVVLSSMRSEIEAAEPQESDPGPDAIRLYVAGRRLALEGDTPGAIERLTDASEFSPDSATIFSELGEAQLANNQRVAAVRSFDRAFKLGSRSPRVLVILAADAEHRGETHRSAALFAAALEQSPGRSDGALPYVIRAGLGESLLALGYERSGAELLGQSLDLPGPVQLRGTRYGPQLRELYRRRGDLWITVGDSACRLGEYDTALTAYAEASDGTSIDAGGALGRQIYVLTRLGRPAAAGLALLDSVELNGMLVDDRQIGVIRSISASNAQTREHLAAAFSVATKRLDRHAPPSVLSGLTRARAAAMTSSAARPVLRQFLEDYPADQRVLRSLLATYESADAAGIAREAVELVNDNPTRAESITHAALSAVFSYTEFMAAIERRTDRSAVLVRAFALARVGYAIEAYTTVRELDDPLSIGERAGRATLAELSGNRTDAGGQTKLLLEDPSPDAQLAAAEILRRSQHPHAARAALLGLLEADPSRSDVELRLMLAELCFSIGLIDEAERHAIEAINLDPAEEAAYRGLISLYQQAPGGPRQRALTEIVRKLRAAAPSSTMLREIAAQENLRRGLLDAAEEQLIALAEANPDNKHAYQLLVALWDQSARQGGFARLDRGEVWLNTRLDARPESPLEAGAFLRLLVAKGEPEEAVLIANETIALRASFDLERMRESIMRARLGLVDEADRLALARLDRGPKTLDTAVERAVILTRMDKIAAAAAAIGWAHDESRTLSTSQHINLSNLVRLKMGLAAENGETSIDASFALIESVVQYGVPLAPEAHAYRAGLLARSSGFEASQAVDAVNLFAIQHPNQLAQAYLIVGSALFNAGHGDAALLLIAGAHDVHETEEIRGQWLRLVVEFGDKPAMNAFVDRAGELGVLSEIIDSITDGSTDLTQLSGDEQRTELIYVIGNIASSFGFEEQAEVAYRAALDRDPRHAWANNNLGYGMAERGENLEEAERMLLIAVEEEQRQSNIVDSLGWLRYMQGRIDDVVDENGAVSEEGALSLLRRATTLPNGMRNTTILDHLGDAAWQAGQHEEAISAWSRSSDSLQMQIQRLKQNRADAAPLLEELDRVGQKIQKAQRGGEPEVAESTFRPDSVPDDPPGQ